MFACPQPDADVLRQRLHQRGKVISHTEPEEVQRFIVGATRLGNLLRAAREYLEGMLPEEGPDLSVLWLWEQGLVLPEEVSSGRVGRLVQWYWEAAARQEGANVHQILEMNIKHLSQMLMNDPAPMD